MQCKQQIIHMRSVILIENCSNVRIFRKSGIQQQIHIRHAGTGRRHEHDLYTQISAALHCSIAKDRKSVV